jgi:hypothetical protein
MFVTLKIKKIDGKTRWEDTGKKIRKCPRI